MSVKNLPDWLAGRHDCRYFKGYSLLQAYRNLKEKGFAIACFS